MSAKYFERVEHIEKLLLIDNLVIDTTALRSACLYGQLLLLLFEHCFINTFVLYRNPDQFRPLCWRLFLHFLPKERQQWTDVLKKQRSYYEGLVKNLSADVTDHSAIPIDDHPLNSPSSSGGRPAQNSEWTNFFKDNEVLLQIDKDVRRLRPEIDFFQRHTAYPKKSFASVDLGVRIHSENLSSDVHEIRFSNKSFIQSNHSSPSTSSNSLCSTSSNLNPKTNPNEITETEELHWQASGRTTTFIFAKLNSGVKYVQGMNEIIGPIYYVFATDPDKEWAEHAEADTFYCFQNLMSEIKDNFIRTLDSSDCGIEAVLSRFYEHFEQLDPSLYKHLVHDLCIRPQFYAFRWISLLLSQEFSLPDVIAVWDTVFSSLNRLESVEYLCLSMIQHIRKELMNGDFSHNVRLLQNFPEVDVSLLVIHSLELMENGRQSSYTSLNGSTTNKPEGMDRLVPAKNYLKSRFSSLMNKTREQVVKYTTSSSHISSDTKD
uniref:Rab-GAP TBC domain-containing protein n=1 Tax=Ditylenchus dipsaci TaxID=166011 RepID=A0A915CU22_9BILA